MEGFTLTVAQLRERARKVITTIELTDADKEIIAALQREAMNRSIDMISGVGAGVTTDRTRKYNTQNIILAFLLTEFTVSFRHFDDYDMFFIIIKK